MPRSGSAHPATYSTPALSGAACFGCRQRFEAGCPSGAPGRRQSPDRSGTFVARSPELDATLAAVQALDQDFLRERATGIEPAFSAWEAPRRGSKVV